MKKIIHGIEKFDGVWQYICNQACSITDEKSTLNPKEVTCKNCKRILKHLGKWKKRK